MGRKKSIPFLVLVMLVLFGLKIPVQGIADQQTTAAGKIRILIRVNSDMSRMGAIYQAMYKLLKQTMNKGQAKMRAAMAVGKSNPQEAGDSIAEKEEQIRNEREAAQENFITACVSAAVKCLGTISGSIARGLGGSMVKPSISIMLFRKYQRNVSKGLTLSRTLEKNIKKLVKDYKRKPYDRNQRQEIRDLLKKLIKLKQELATAKQRNTNYINILKTNSG